MLDTRHRRRLDTARAFARLSPRRWSSAQPTSSRAPHCPHVIVVVVGQAALTRRGGAALPAGKAALRRSDGFAERSPLLQRAPGRPTLPDGGAGGGGLHAAGAAVGDGGDARRRRRRASQVPRAAVSSAACVIRAPRHDRTSALLILPLSCLVRLGFAQVLGERASGREGRRGRGERRPRQPATRNVLLPWLARMEMLDKRHQRPLDRVRVVAVATPSPSPCLSRRSRSSKRSRHRRRLRGRRAK